MVDEILGFSDGWDVGQSEIEGLSDGWLLGFALSDGDSEGIEDGTPDTLGSKEGVVVGCVSQSTCVHRDYLSTHDTRDFISTF